MGDRREEGGRSTRPLTTPGTNATTKAPATVAKDVVATIAPAGRAVPAPRRAVEIEVLPDALRPVRRVAIGTMGVEGLARAWEAFHASEDDPVEGRDARERLVAHYTETLVRRIARRMMVRLPGEVEEDDLVQEGAIALDRALDRYATDRGTRFDTFASKHVSGAMLDSLRRIDPATRGARRREKTVREARERFRVEHGRPPSDDELRELLDVNEADFVDWERDGRMPVRVHLSADGPDGEMGGDGNPVESLPDHRRHSPLDSVVVEDLRRFITKGLDREDRLIVLLYYAEQLTMSDVANVLGISESRVSQKMKNLREIVRRKLESMESPTRH